MFAPVLWLCLFAAMGWGYTTFDPVCTLPQGSVNFVSSPDVRGTMEIIWGSLFTLIACTWTIHHPNVPEQRDGRDPGWKGDLWWGLKSAWESAKLALVTVLAPELIIAIAWDQFRLASKIEKQLKKLIENDNVPWSLVHGHYAAMGGFIIRYNMSTEGSRGGVPYHLTADDVIFLRKSGHLEKLPNVTRDELCDKSKSDPLLKLIAIVQILWSIIQISARAMRRLPISLLELSVLALAACAIAIYLLCWDRPKHVEAAITVLTYEHRIPAEVDQGLEQVETSAIWAIFFDTAAQELRAIHNTDPPPQGAPLSNTRIQFNYEKEKADDERTDDGRAVAESTVGESMVDVRTADGRTIEEETGNEEPGSEEIRNVNRSDEEEIGNDKLGNKKLGDEEMGTVKSVNNEEGSDEKRDEKNKLGNEKLGVALSLFVAATLFGAVHVAGWNLSFPTLAEQIIWRCAGIYIMILPCMIAVFYRTGLYLGGVLGLKDKIVHSFLGFGCAFFSWVYLLARLFILVETVRTFISLPPNVFVATWTVNIPHFA